MQSRHCFPIVHIMKTSGLRGRRKHMTASCPADELSSQQPPCRGDIIMYLVQNKQGLFTVSILCLRAFQQCFSLGLSPEATCLSLRYSVSDKKNIHIISFKKDRFMKNKTYNVLYSEMLIEVCFKHRPQPSIPGSTDL